MRNFLGLLTLCGMILAGSVNSRAMTPEEYFDVDVFYPLNFAEGNHADAFLGEGMEILLKTDKQALKKLQEEGVAFLPIPGGRRGELDVVLYYLAENDKDHLIPSYLAAVLPSRNGKMPTHIEQIERAEEWLKKHHFSNLNAIVQEMSDSAGAWEEVATRTYKAMEPSLTRIGSTNKGIMNRILAEKVGPKPTPKDIPAAAPYATTTVVRDKDGTYSMVFGYVKNDPIVLKDQK